MDRRGSVCTETSFATESEATHAANQGLQVTPTAAVLQPQQDPPRRSGSRTSGGSRRSRKSSWRSQGSQSTARPAGPPPLEGADAERVDAIFHAFDAGKGVWGFEEARAARLALRGEDLTRGLYIGMCAQLAALPAEGWLHRHVEALYQHRPVFWDTDILSDYEKVQALRSGDGASEQGTAGPPPQPEQLPPEPQPPPPPPQQQQQQWAGFPQQVPPAVGPGAQQQQVMYAQHAPQQMGPPQTGTDYAPQQQMHFVPGHGPCAAPGHAPDGYPPQQQHQQQHQHQHQPQQQHQQQQQPDPQAEIARLRQQLEAAESARAQTAPPTPPAAPRPVSPPLRPAAAAPGGGAVFDQDALQSLARFLSDCRTPLAAAGGDLSSRLAAWAAYVAAAQKLPPAAAGAPAPPSEPLGQPAAGRAGEVRPAGPQRGEASLPALAPGDAVEVRCADGAGNNDRWEAATVTRLDRRTQLYTVTLPGGEEWDKVPRQDVRLVAAAARKTAPQHSAELQSRDMEIERLRREISRQNQGAPPRAARQRVSEDGADGRPHAPQGAGGGQRGGGDRHYRGEPELPHAEQTAAGTADQWAVHNLAPDELAYSGWLWREPAGWLQSRSKAWLIVIGDQLYIGSTPCDEQFEVLSLQGAQVEIRAKGADIRVSCPKEDAELLLSADSDYERVVWQVQLEAAAMRGRRPQSGDAAVRRTHEAILAELPWRPCVPVLEHGELPEGGAEGALLSGHGLVSTASTWLGAPSWTRRWVTLHQSHFTVRDQRAGCSGLQVYPFRDTDLTEKAMGGEHPSALEVTGPWIPAVLLTWEGPAFGRWADAFAVAHARSNPDRLLPPEAEAEQHDQRFPSNPAALERPAAAGRPRGGMVSDSLRSDGDGDWGQRRRVADAPPHGSRRARPASGGYGPS
eukprot:TRINITY_DN4269_c2_g2_i2.p1 TRINITY_DN4269_c2_g2~~TRINITY_DN4269_c2_g2_i2.p1  ORF type:complete len:929 (+),score=306.70 TRINITY_DN4269_c2_g2_i2:66-2789(+)